MNKILNLIRWALACLPLFSMRAAPTDDENKNSKAPAPATPKDKGAPWLALARKEEGVTEGPGAANNPKILAYFADAGHPEVIKDSTAWCAAFANAMLVRAGFKGTGQLTAISFKEWGKPLKTPKLGAITVFQKPGSWQGHVGFYVGEDKDHIFVLGGNQWDTDKRASVVVNVEKISKRSRSLKFVGYRWPVTMKNSHTAKATAVATVGTGMALAAKAGAEVAQASPTDAWASIIPFAAELKSGAEYLPILGLVGTVLTTLALGFIAWHKWHDVRVKKPKKAKNVVAG